MLTKFPRAIITNLLSHSLSLESHLFFFQILNDLASLLTCKLLWGSASPVFFLLFNISSITSPVFPVSLMGNSLRSISYKTNPTSILLKGKTYFQLFPLFSITLLYLQPQSYTEIIWSQGCLKGRTFLLALDFSKDTPSSLIHSLNCWNVLPTTLPPPPSLLHYPNVLFYWNICFEGSQDPPKDTSVFPIHPG